MLVTITVTVLRIMWLMHAVEYHMAAGSRSLDQYINIEWSETNKQKTQSNKLEESRNRMWNETNQPKNIANYYTGLFMLVKILLS